MIVGVIGANICGFTIVSWCDRVGNFDRFGLKSCRKSMKGLF